MAVFYSSVGQYIRSKSSIVEKIAAMDTVIAALIERTIEAAEDPSGTGRYDEYFINDGQTQLRTKYRSLDDLKNGIKAFETLREMYVNQYNGRAIRLVDGSNFINIYPCG